MISMSAVVNGLVVLGAAAFLGWRGYERGVIRTVQRLVSIVSGYLACYFFAGSFAAYLEKSFALHGLQSFIVSGLLLLLGASTLTNWYLSYYATRLEEQEEEPARMAGMLIGIILGALLGVIAVWVSSITMDAVQLNKEGAASLQGRNADPIRKMAGNIVGSAVGYAVEKKMGQDGLAPAIAAQLIGDPVAASQQFVQASTSEEMKNFFSDPSVQSLMANNKIDELQQHPAFQKLMSTPQTTHALALLGASIKNDHAMTKEERTARLLTDLYQKSRAVQSDPQFLELSKQADFQQLVKNPSPQTLLSSSAFEKLGKIIFSKKAPPANQSIAKPQWQKVEPKVESVGQGAPIAGENHADAPTEEAVPMEDQDVIYRWTDENGLKHFSQKKPQGNYELEMIRSQR